MSISTQASGTVESFHWQQEQDTMTAIDDDLRSGELMDEDVAAEEVYSDLESSGSDTSFDEAMEQTWLDWQREREMLRNFNSDMSGLR